MPASDVSSVASSPRDGASPPVASPPAASPERAAADRSYSDDDFDDFSSGPSPTKPADDGSPKKTKSEARPQSPPSGDVELNEGVREANEPGHDEQDDCLTVPGSTPPTSNRPSARRQPSVPEAKPTSDEEQRRPPAAGRDPISSDDDFSDSSDSPDDRDGGDHNFTVALTPRRLTAVPAQASSDVEGDACDAQLVEVGDATRVGAVPDEPGLDPGVRQDRNEGRTQRRSPRERLRLPQLKRGQVASDMITRLVERPLELQQHSAPWRDSPRNSAAAEAANVTRRTVFPYEATSDKFLARYWQRRDVAKEEWRKEAARRRERKNRRAGSQQQLRRAPEEVASLQRVGSAPAVTAAAGLSADSPKSVGIGSEASGVRRGASWNVSAFPLNVNPVSSHEFGSLKAIFVPSTTFQSKIRVPNVDLAWLRPIAEGEFATVGDAAAHIQHQSTKNLRNMKYDCLASDWTPYGLGAPFQKTLITSPRSAIILLRNGTQAYDLLERPAKFYASPSDNVTAAVLHARRGRAEAERQGLVSSLLQAYDTLCAEYTAEHVADILRPRTVTDTSGAAIIAEKVERDKRQLAFLNERTRKIAEVARGQKEAAAAKAIAIETKLKEKAEKKDAAVRVRAAQVAEELAAKKRIMQRIEEEQARITAELHEASAERRVALHARVEQLQAQRKQAAVERRALKQEQAEASLRRVQENDAERIAMLEAQEMTKRERAEQYQKRVAEERAQRAQRSEDQELLRELNKARAEQLADELRDKVESKLEAADQRQEEFEMLRDRDRLLRSMALKARHEQILAAVEVAQEMEAERAERIRQRQEEQLAAISQRQAEREEQARAAGEASAFDVGHKRKVVDLTAQQQQFARLVQLSQLQAREAEIGDLEEHKRSLVAATRQSRMELRISDRAVKEQSALESLRDERRSAAAIYAVSHPKLDLPVASAFRDVGPRVDAGGARSASATPYDSQGSHVPPPSTSKKAPPKKVALSALPKRAHSSMK
jgi:hypothetical protein